MFGVYYEAWTANSTTLVCGGDWADDTSTKYVSGDDMNTDSTTCAYDVFFHYIDGTSATGGAIDASTQDFIIYTDSAVVAAASFAAAGVAAMFL